MKTAALLSLKDLSFLIQNWKRSKDTIAFVPTMGALHDGHLSLVKIAKQHAKKTVVSIFVNPIQFGPNEDFNKYPRTFESDLEKLTKIGTDAVFFPNNEEIYPNGFSTYVYNREMSSDLCGASRPGHFEGVLTVVLKLFNIVDPDYSVFGKKDYQQWKLIEKMSLDLNLRTKVIGADIVREPHGLAMSSRNNFLSIEDRDKAAIIYKSLTYGKTLYKDGCRSVKEICQAVKSKLCEEKKIQVEYLELRQQDLLMTFPNDIVTSPAVVLVAVRLGDVRLIDNLELN